MKINNNEEAKAHILGMIKGLNEARLAVWGIGYDDDETAKFIRNICCKRIVELKEILNIEYIEDSSVGG